MSISVVLIEPKDSINVGSVARAMDNFSFESLTLVSPRGYDQGIAKRSACWATNILENTKIVTTLDDALGDSHHVIGFSSREGGALSKTSSLATLLNQKYFTEKKEKKMTLLFGPEESGLSNDILLRCNDIVHIETNLKNPSINLSHSVAIVLYQLRNHSLFLRQENEQPCQDEHALFSEYNSLEKLITHSLEHSGFFNPHTPSEIPSLLFQVFKRAHLTKREMAVLQGVFGSISRSKVP